MRRVLILLPLLAGSLSACGGGPSKAEVLADADATCEPSNRTIAGASEPTVRADLAATAGRLTSAIDSQLVELRKLKVPSGGTGDQIEALWVSMAGVAEASGVLQRAATASVDPAAAQAMRDTASRFQTTSSQAEALGFTSCGVGMKAAVNQLSGGTRAILKASYLAKGDSFCEAAGKSLDAIPEPSSRTLSTTARYMDRTVPILEKAITDIRNLPAPPGDEAIIAEMNDAQAAVVTKAKEFRTVMVKDPVKILTVGPELDSLTTIANGKTVSYGFKLCGTRGTGSRGTSGR